MAKFVHLAPEKLCRRIERSGLRGRPRSIRKDGGVESLDVAVHVVPQVSDFTHTHQWMRELRRWNGRLRMVAVVAQVRDTDQVWIGRYSQPKVEVSAAASVELFEADPWGNEVIIPHHIEPSRLAVRSVRQDVGWQGTPEGHSQCVCPSCLDAGHPRFVRRINAVYRDALASGQLLHAEDALERARGRLPVERLLRHSSTQPAAVARLLHRFKWPEIEAPLRTFLRSESDEVRAAAAGSVLSSLPLESALSIIGTDDPAIAEEICNYVEWCVDAEVALGLLVKLAAHSDDEIARLAATSIPFVKEPDQNPTLYRGSQDLLVRGR